MTARLPVPGTIARGEMPGSNEFLTGKNDAGEFLTTNPLPVDDGLLARGAERYEIYCTPCHDARGTGRGILFEWGSVPTASFHDEQRRAYPDGQVFDVITNGFGLMQGYRWPISAADRWAIVAYVNLLQEQREARQASRAGTP